MPAGDKLGAAPEPLVELAIELPSGAREPVGEAILTAGSQPHIRMRADHETGRIVLGGWSEEQLYQAAASLGAALQGGYRVGAVAPACRCTLREPIELEHCHKQQSGGSGQFGCIKIRLIPGKRFQGIRFFDEIRADHIPRPFIPAVEQGLREKAASPGVSAFPMIDLDIHLLDGKYHDVDSSALAFELTGRGAMAKALAHATLVMLEPVAAVTVLAPEQHWNGISALLRARGATVDGPARRDETGALHASGKMAGLLGFEAQLRAMSEGSARVEMSLAGYVERPSEPPRTVPMAAALRA